MKLNSLIKLFCLLLIVSFAAIVSAQISSGRIEIFATPRSGSFVEGSTFDVPILINTNGSSIEGIKVKVSFDKDRLSIVEPSGGRSVVGSWVESPAYDNSLGTVSYVGDIPDGLVTASGLVATITFKAVASGAAVVSINQISEITLHDDLHTKAALDLGRAEYSILPKLSEGPNVFSETHQFAGKWYNNNSPVISWNRDENVAGFSFALDNKPFTVPDNIIDGDETTKSFEGLTDGLWYFHVKAMKASGWGTTAHFLFKIDTVPPAEFTPSASSLFAGSILTGRMLVSFFTTDNLSGVDHYEVGTIDKNQPPTEAPVFIQTGSPFQVPVLDNNASIRVIVRAFDKAGNVREGTLQVNAPFVLWGFVKSHSISFGAVFILILIMLYTLRKYRSSPPAAENSMSSLERDIDTYLRNKKEKNAINIREKEKIEMLERDLESAKMEINKEIHEIQN